MEKEDTPQKAKIITTYSQVDNLAVIHETPKGIKSRLHVNSPFDSLGVMYLPDLMVYDFPKIPG